MLLCPHRMSFNRLISSINVFAKLIVRLPAAYRFDGKEVYIRKDLKTGDVILSPKPESRNEFFELLKKVKIPKDFMVEREDSPPQDRESIQGRYTTSHLEEIDRKIFIVQIMIGEYLSLFWTMFVSDLIGFVTHTA